MNTRALLRPVPTAAEPLPHDELKRLRLMNSRLLSALRQSQEREALAQRLADRDSLTGLYNRRRLLQLLESTIGDAAQQGRKVGLLFIDLNGFKGINDEHGHAAGDRILTIVAQRISARVRSGDIVGRYGGDEFVVILPDVAHWDDVTQVVETVRERVALPVRIDGREQYLSAAIGAAIYPHHAETVEELLQRADQAMYLLKARIQAPQWSFGASPAQQPLRRRNDRSKLRAGSE